MLNYQERSYRLFHKPGFNLELSYRESDIYLSCNKPVDEVKVKDLVKKYYSEVEEYAMCHPQFFASLSPLAVDENAAPIIKDMLGASGLSGIGPFSAVAGAIAWYVGKEILTYCGEVILENGGDLFLKTKEDKRIGLYAGKDFEKGFITIKVKGRDYPFGIASSSSKIGPSLNFGRADLVTVIASTSILADTFATAFSNKIKKPQDVKKIIEEAKKCSFIEGIAVVFENKITLWGALELDS